MRGHRQAFTDAGFLFGGHFPGTPRSCTRPLGFPGFETKDVRADVSRTERKRAMTKRSKFFVAPTPFGPLCDQDSRCQEALPVQQHSTTVLLLCAGIPATFIYGDCVSFCLFGVCVLVFRLLTLLHNTLRVLFLFLARASSRSRQSFLSQFPLHGITLQHGGVRHRCGAWRTRPCCWGMLRIAWRSFSC